MDSGDELGRELVRRYIKVIPVYHINPQLHQSGRHWLQIVNEIHVYL